MMLFIMNPGHGRVHTNASQIDFQQGNTVPTIAKQHLIPLSFSFSSSIFVCLFFSLTFTYLAMSATQNVTRKTTLRLRYFPGTKIIVKTTMGQISCLLHGRPCPVSSARASAHSTTTELSMLIYLLSNLQTGGAGIGDGKRQHEELQVA